MEDKTFLQSDVIKMIEILRDLIGGGSYSMYWGGSTAIDARRISVPKRYSGDVGVLNPEFSTPESDVDIVVVNPLMTTASLMVALEALALVNGLAVTIRPGDDNGNYEGLPIARRFIISGLSRDIDLILCDRSSNIQASMCDYVTSIDSKLIAKNMVRINFGDMWKYPDTIASSVAMLQIEEDLRDMDRVRGTDAFGDRQLKMLSRLTNLKNLLQNY